MQPSNFQNCVPSVGAGAGAGFVQFSTGGGSQMNGAQLNFNHKGPSPVGPDAPKKKKSHKCLWWTLGIVLVSGGVYLGYYFLCANRDGGSGFSKI